MTDSPQHIGARPRPVANQAPQQGQEEAEWDLSDLLGLVWLNKYFLAMCALIAALIGGYYAYVVADVRYSATARLALEVREQRVVNLDSVVSGVSTELAAINTELEFVTSREFIEILVDDLNLVEDPEFNPTLREEPTFTTARAKAIVREMVFGPIPTQPAPSKEDIRRATVSAVRGAITVNARRNSYIFNITATTGDQRKSAAIANQLATIYMDQQIRQKFEATEYAINWLSERVIELEGELLDRENAIKTMRSATDVVSAEALDALNIRSKDLRDRMLSAQSSADVARQRSADAVAVAATGDVAQIAEFFSNPTLNDLTNDLRLGTNSDQARQQFDSYVGLLVDRARADAARRASQAEALAESYAQLQARIEQQNTDLNRLNQMVRETDATRVLYETFLTRLKETSLQIGLQQADVRILSRALQGVQVAPRRSRIILLAFMIGGALGLGYTFWRQMRNNSIRTSGDLERLTGLGVLGQVPALADKKRRSILDYLRTRPTSAAAEAIRNIRTSLLLSNVDEPPQVIMSTSSIPAEGKTTLAIALTLNLAGLGKKVLLIEGDIRRRTFTNYFDHDVKHGIVSAISGEKPLSEVVIHDEALGADLIMGDRSTANAADIFSSERFRALVAELRDIYDFVIIDSPPVLVVPDARVIGHSCDAVIYSVKWDSTQKDQVQEGIRQLTSVGLRPTGVVLSQVNLKRMKAYGYAYGYGGRYGSYARYGYGYGYGREYYDK